MKPLSRTPAEHIAVGLQILYPLDGGDFGPVTKGQRELINAAASTILSQHEEIQRLKGVCLDAYERAAQVCEALDEHSITLPQAIRALKTGEPK